MSAAWVRTANATCPFPQHTVLKHPPPTRPPLPHPLALRLRGLDATGVDRAAPPCVGIKGRTRPKGWKGSEGCCASLREHILQVAAGTASGSTHV